MMFQTQVTVKLVMLGFIAWVLFNLPASAVQTDNELADLGLTELQAEKVLTHESSGTSESGEKIVFGTFYSVHLDDHAELEKLKSTVAIEKLCTYAAWHYALAHEDFCVTLAELADSEYLPFTPSSLGVEGDYVILGSASPYYLGLNDLKGVGEDKWKNAAKRRILSAFYEMVYFDANGWEPWSNEKPIPIEKLEKNPAFWSLQTPVHQDFLVKIRQVPISHFASSQAGRLKENVPGDTLVDIIASQAKEPDQHQTEE
jgi:hypothetical protein